jgi:hypothetical protein
MIKEKIEYLSTILIDYVIYKYMYNMNNLESIIYLYEEIDRKELLGLDKEYIEAFNRIENIIKRLQNSEIKLKEEVGKNKVENIDKIFAIQKLMVINSNMSLSKLMNLDNNSTKEDSNVIENIVDEIDYLIMLCINYLINYIVTGEKKNSLILELFKKIEFYISRNEPNEYTLIRFNRSKIILNKLDILDIDENLQVFIKNKFEDFDNNEKAVKLATQSLINNTL